MKATTEPDPLPMSPTLRGLAALFLTPGLCVLAFEAANILIPGFREPLLGGIHIFLYLFVLIWLVIALAFYFISVFRFNLKRGNIKFLIIAISIIALPYAALVILGVFELIINFDGIGYIRYFSQNELLAMEIKRSAIELTITILLTFCAALVFLAIGGAALIGTRRRGDASF